MSPFRFATVALAFFLYGASVWKEGSTFAQTKQPPVLDPPLLAALNDPNPSIRQEAVRRLRDVRPISPEVMAAFNQALQDESQDVRGEAVFALSEIGSDAKGTAPMLLKVLTNKEEAPHVRFDVPLALGKMRPVSADIITVLVQVAEDMGDTLVIRARAIEALGDIGLEASAAVPTLQKLATEDASKLVQIKAWEALAKIQPGNQEAIQMLVEVVQGKRGGVFDATAGVFSTSFNVVPSALKTLVQIGAIKEGLPLLIQGVKNENEKGEIRFIAADLLGELGPTAKPAIPALIEFLHTPSRTEEIDAIKYFVIGALYKIDPTSEQVIATFKEIAARDPAQNLRDLAAFYLAQMSSRKEQLPSR